MYLYLLILVSETKDEFVIEISVSKGLITAFSCFLSIQSLDEMFSRCKTNSNVHKNNVPGLHTFSFISLLSLRN